VEGGKWLVEGERPPSIFYSRHSKKDGGRHEEASQKQSIEGGLEEEKCQKLPEKV
jgi:hypothetical protein